MRPWRILYTVLIVASLGLAATFYYKYYLGNSELAAYQQLSRLSSQALTEVTKQLDKSLKEKEGLNSIIATLEKEKGGFKDRVQALKEEREELQLKIARLFEEKTFLEKRYLLLTQRFESLEELKRAIKIAKIERRRRMKTERIQRRLAKIEMLKALDEIALHQGNRGLMVKAGKPTFKSRGKVTVELEPLKSSYGETEGK